MYRLKWPVQQLTLASFDYFLQIIFHKSHCLFLFPANMSLSGLSVPLQVQFAHFYLPFHKHLHFLDKVLQRYDKPDPKFRFRIAISSRYGSHFIWINLAFFLVFFLNMPICVLNHSRTAWIPQKAAARLLTKMVEVIAPFTDFKRLFYATSKNSLSLVRSSIILEIPWLTRQSHHSHSK